MFGTDGAFGRDRKSRQVSERPNDSRTDVPNTKEVEEVKGLGIKVVENQTVHKAIGSKSVTGVTIGSEDGLQSVR